MAFYIAKSDHDKAREIAKRALEKINFREEAERLNVYLAWFNMENACKKEEEAEKVSDSIIIFPVNNTDEILNPCSVTALHFEALMKQCHQMSHGGGRGSKIR